MTFLKEHQDKIHGIAHRVALFIINENIKECFTSNINRFFKMVEDYGQAQQPYAKELEKTKKRIEKDKNSKQFEGRFLTDICPPPKGYIKIDSKDNSFINVPIGVIYRPAEPVNPLLWFGFFGNATLQRQPTEEEILMCDYFLLATIHDQELQDPTDRPIFSQQYEGKWFRRDEFLYALWQHNRCPEKVFTDDYDYEPSQQRYSDYIYERKLKRAFASSEQYLTQFRKNSNDKLAKLERALHQVQTDCTKLKPQEKAGQGEVESKEQKKKITKLTDFIINCCEDAPSIQSKANRIHEFVKKREIKFMPKTVNRPKGNETKLYYEDELRQIWPKLKEKIKSLPNLKD